jgi:hypothetical protein
MKKKEFRDILIEKLNEPGVMDRIFYLQDLQGDKKSCVVYSARYRPVMVDLLPGAKAVEKWIKVEAFSQFVMREYLKEKGLVEVNRSLFYGKK